MRWMLLAGVLLSGCRAPPRQQQPPAPSRENILIVSFDTLRADHLGSYGYDPYAEPVSPHLDGLAREGRRFTRCFAPRGETAPSLCSLMTGCYPSRHGVLENQQKFLPGMQTLAEQLNAQGFATGAFVGVVPGHVDGKAFRGFTEVVEARKTNTKGTQYEWDTLAEEGLLRFLAARGGDARPFCAWAHFYDVHFPFAPPAPEDTRFSGDYAGPMRWSAAAPPAEYDRRIKNPLNGAMLRRAPLEREDARYLVALYDGGIRATDDRVGRILQRLDELGLAPNTVVIFTADHGEELAEHNQHWFHASSVYESVLHVPLIVRGPGIRAGVSDRLVQNVDVLPTLLARLGFAPAVEIDGVSFADALWEDAPATPPRTIAWSEWQDLILGARTDRWKLIVNPRGARPKKPPYFGIDGDGGYAIECFELYDLQADPRETKNVWTEQRDAVADLLALAKEEFARRFLGRSFEAATEDDEAERRAMEQLGYAAGGEERTDVLLDPAACRDDE